MERETVGRVGKDEEREKGETTEERRVEECVLLSLQPQSYIT